MPAALDQDLCERGFQRRELRGSRLRTICASCCFAPRISSPAIERPRGVMKARVLRRSAASSSRRTSPISSRRLIALVRVGCCAHHFFAQLPDGDAVAVRQGGERAPFQQRQVGRPDLVVEVLVHHQAGEARSR